MPELPDLQIFSHNLKKKLKGKKLERINIKVAAKLNVSERELSDALEKQVLTNVKRVGKELHFEFENGNVLGFHLMLHGQLFFFDQVNKQNHTIAELIFEDSTGLALIDFQKAATPTLNPPENLTKDALAVDFEYLKQKLTATRTAVKTVIMDQHIIRGIGNAYADEILYDAKISPFSAANKIPDAKIKQLAKSIIDVLKDAEKQILNNRPDMISGEYRDFLKVHQPKKKQTPNGSTIHQKPVGARKTYYTDEQELYN